MKTPFVYFLMCIALCLLTKPLQGQTTHIQLSYLGGYITNPGLKLGYSKSFHSHEKLNRKERTVRTEWRYGASLGSYVHRRNHSSIQLLPEIAYLHTRGSGFQWGASLGAGYQRTFIADSYQLGADGQVEKTPWAGQHLFALNPAIRLGKQLKESDFSWFIQPQLLLSFPYFAGANRYFLMEAGLSYTLH